MMTQLAKGIAYVLLPSTDLARSVTFYRDILGVPLVWWEKQQGHAAFQCSDLLLVLSTHEAPSPGGVCIALEAADIDLAHSALLERRIAFPKGMEEHGGRRTARFADPDGNLLELNQTRVASEAG